MTIQEMHIKIEQEVFHVDGLMPQRIDDVLNSQIESFVRSKIPATRNTFKEGVDDSVIAAKDLDTLKVYFYQLENPIITGTERKISFTLPSNCLYPLGFDILINFSITRNQASEQHPTRISSGRMIDFVQAGEISENAILKSDYKSPMGILVNNNLQIMCDKSFILKELYLTYLRKPAIVSLTLNTNCDLPESVHNLIVDRAIAYILENSESERVQTKSVFNQKNE